jgi:hypothetical protein
MPKLAESLVTVRQTRRGILCVHLAFSTVATTAMEPVKKNVKIKLLQAYVICYTHTCDTRLARDSVAFLESCTPDKM